MRDEKEKEEYNIHKGFSAELISKKAFLLILLLMLLDHMIYLYLDYQLIYLKDITNEEAYFHTRSINQLNSLGHNLQNFLLYHRKYWKDMIHEEDCNRVSVECLMILNLWNSFLS